MRHRAAYVVLWGIWDSATSICKSGALLGSLFHRLFGFEVDIAAEYINLRSHLTYLVSLNSSPPSISIYILKALRHLILRPTSFLLNFNSHREVTSHTTHNEIQLPNHPPPRHAHPSPTPRRLLLPPPYRYPRPLAHQRRRMVLYLFLPCNRGPHPLHPHTSTLPLSNGRQLGPRPRTLERTRARRPWRTRWTPLGRLIRLGPLRHRELGPLEPVVYELRLALRALDRVVGRQCVSRDGLAGMD